MTRKPRKATDASLQAGLPLEPSVTTSERDGPASFAPRADEPASFAPRADERVEWLAQGFADRVVDWARARGAPADVLSVLHAAACALSVATASGHACVGLAEIAPSVEEVAGVRAALLASKVVAAAGVHRAEDGDADDASPLVLDADDRLYLYRYFDYERRIAKRLLRGSTRTLDAHAATRLAAELATLFAPNATAPAGAADWQKLAAALAVLNDVTVISGGPGTGKTTTVVNLLACLLALDPGCRVALAAPTGKAAARMQDAIRRRAAHLPPELQQRLPAESFTIHRLLGVIPDSHEFRHHAGNPLPIDVLVVDEASMLDLALAARLFDAVPPSARIVLLGDKDQLAAVESGAVFSELCADPTLTRACAERLAALCVIPAEQIVAPRLSRATPLHDRVVWLTRNFRFAADSGIGRLAREINAGDADAAIAYLRTGGDGTVVWRDENLPGLAPEALALSRKGYAGYIEALRANCAHHDAVFDAFERFRILCAERESPRGVADINEHLRRHCQRALADAWPSSPRSPWYYGCPVMVLRNDYVLRLYNGDIGIALPDAEGRLLVHFRETDGTFRAIAPVRLPEHETAFATTVHKAQGSEFDEVVLVLPSRPSRVATRELVYTAITRAKRKVTLVCGEEALRAAIATPTVRHSGLIARLQAEATALAARGSAVPSARGVEP